MPDLPELYAALDENLEMFLHANKEEGTARARFISALCAAIEVKEGQELQEYLNSETTHAGHQEEEAEAQTPPAEEPSQEA